MSPEDTEKILGLDEDVCKYKRNAARQRSRQKEGRQVIVRPEFWEQCARDAVTQIMKIRQNDKLSKTNP